ncbi:MAG TPA: ATP-dependent helicase [Oligoflexia bacterium]|nr:ATP-dependent helicase [Oligoflexia bacterium]HMP48745.1 ATP-dependent helicase [Oligoflexia bacterium]
MSGSAKKYILKPLETSINSSFNIDYESELNSSQLEAVKTTNGPILCIAGAGSGKTRTLIYRVAYLIENGTPPENILLLTFTRKAANEMMRRASSLLDDRCRKIRGGTFHGFSNSILRRFAEEAGLEPNFNIIDRGDAEDLLNLVRTDTGVAKEDTRFPKKKTLLEVFSKSVNTGKSIHEILTIEYPQFEELSGTINKLYEDYQKVKRARAVLDYDDLLVELKLLLTCNKEVRARLSRELKYIMIDEYQDTNQLQADIGGLLASEHGNILAVGDDSQSIYSFRGAEFRNIMDFPSRYEGTRLITLEQNYRSTEPILKFANALLEPAREKYAKNLFSLISSEQKPVFIRPGSVTEEARFITQRILELREEGVPLEKIAVLFRAAWHSNELEISLNSAKIPFIKVGGIKFVEAAHVKDLLAFLRVAKNHRDAVAWHRILLLLEGIGPKTAKDIIKYLVEESPDLKNLDSHKKKKFGGLLSELRLKIIETRKYLESPQSAVDLIKNYYYPIMKSHYDDYLKRIDDLNSLSDISSRYNSLESFMDDLSLELPEQSQSEIEPTEKDDEKLTLSTIHSAKGLEWHSVFIISLIDGFIPSSRALQSEKEIEEERRLFYVACTRAERNLYLSAPESTRGRGFSPTAYGFSFSEKSRFLDEISNFDELTEYWSLEGNFDDW